MKQLKPFRFKQFEVQHDRCAMKVNTDGILLGAWTDVTNVNNALDVGTGSGLIALMLAQRGVNYIEAIEIDGDAASQAVDNFQASPWGHKIKVLHVPVQQYMPRNNFDLIISNPPYFENGLKTSSENRNLARHNDSLPLDDLVAFANSYLAPEGKLVVILPIDLQTKAINIAKVNGLYGVSCCFVKGNAAAEAKRVLISFGREPEPLLVTEIAIETAPMQYSTPFKQLTQDFYLAH